MSFEREGAFGRPGRDAGPAAGTAGPSSDLPLGSDLPLPGQRWTPQRKLAVLAALAAGRLSREAIWLRYRITEHELVEWQFGLLTAGLDGLSLKRLKERRRFALR